MGSVAGPQQKEGRGVKIALLAASAILSGCSAIQLVLPVEGQAQRRPDEKVFYALEAAWHAENIVDMGQTVHIANSRRTDEQMATWAAKDMTAERYCFQEVNPLTRSLIGKHPSQKEVIASSILWSMAYRGISEFIARRDTQNEYGERNSPWYVARWVWHVGMLGAKTWQVGHNSSMGLKPFGSGCKE